MVRGKWQLLPMAAAAVATTRRVGGWEFLTTVSRVLMDEEVGGREDVKPEPVQ